MRTSIIFQMNGPPSVVRHNSGLRPGTQVPKKTLWGVQTRDSTCLWASRQAIAVSKAVSPPRSDIKSCPREIHGTTVADKILAPLLGLVVCWTLQGKPSYAAQRPSTDGLRPTEDYATQSGSSGITDWAPALDFAKAAGPTATLSIFIFNLSRQLGGIDLKIENLGQKIDDTDKRVDGSEKRLTERVDGVEKRLTERIDDVDKRIDGSEKRLTERVDGVEKRLTERIDGVDKRIDGSEKRLTERVDGVEKRLTERIDGGIAELKEFKIDMKSELQSMRGEFTAEVKRLDANINKMGQDLSFLKGVKSEREKQVKDRTTPQ